MSGEIRLKADTGLTVKARIIGEDGKVWDGTSMVAESALTDAQWTASLLACTEGQTSESTDTGLYLADWPAALTQDAIYSVVFYSGASPSPGDVDIGDQDNPTEYDSGSGTVNVEVEDRSMEVS